MAHRKVPHDIYIYVTGSERVKCSNFSLSSSLAEQNTFFKVIVATVMTSLTWYN